MMPGSLKDGLRAARARRSRAGRRQSLIEAAAEGALEGYVGCVGSGGQ